MTKYFLVVLVATLWAGFVFPTATAPVEPTGPASFVAPKDKAMVVFVRPEKFGKAVWFYILDKNKNLVTMLKGNEHVAITTSPGTHVFHVVSENATTVQAELGAGRTYIVHTKPKMGMGKARVIVEAALRGTPSFAASAEWVRDAKPGEPDFGKGKKWVSKHQSAIDSRIDEAETLTMGVEDGRTQEEAAAL
ncbi:MAG: hypothetical protein E4H00_02190 [Myxococcales bacterium]|jgi:hypothetical protein|nr:MAG: hypothetical protein E4H00_02190 [Myxococcales bacterium]